MKLNDLKEQRALRVTEMRSILSAAESAKRNLTADEQAKFDKLKGEVASIEADEARAQFLEDAERRSIGTSAEHRDHANLEGQVSIMRILQAGMEGRALNGAEAEYAAETERRTGRKAQGVFVPMAALEKRVNTTTTGNDLVATDHRADQYIGPFRNSLLARKLAVETAMRQGELLSLPWPRVDMKRRLALLVDPEKIKNEEPRAVPLSSAAIKVLKGLPRSVSGLVLPVERLTLYHAFRYACDRAKIESFTFHDLRHEALSRLAERGDFSVLEMAAVSGHKTLQMLKRYTHLQAEKLATKLG